VSKMPDVAAGLHNPGPSLLTAVPQRAPKSARRTSTTDIHHVNGGVDSLALAGRARDIVTAPDGAAAVRRVALLATRVGVAGKVTALRAHPDGERVAALVGRPARTGFRTGVRAAVPEHARSVTPLNQLLNEVPVAVLLSGFTAPERRSERKSSAGMRADVCVGWRNDGPAMEELRRTGQLPVESGPPAPSLEVSDDRFAWHTVPPLPPGAMRRRRLLDVVPGPPIEAYSMFRDTYVDPDGTERVLHEYTLSALFDEDFLVEGIDACPGALPFAQCPAAAASARHSIGHRAESLADVVDRDLWGPSTCTHLNDLLRTLVAVPGLVALARSVLAE
jgi:hypothetical protein